LIRIDKMKNRFLKKDRVDGIIWLLLGLSICIGSLPLKLGKFDRPGAGFMPFLSGAVLGTFGLLLMFSTISKGLNGNGKVIDEKVLEKENRGKLYLTCLVLFSYIILFESLGFYFSTFLFLFILFKLFQPKGWLLPLVLSVGAVILSYLIFSVWLKCRLPRGMMHF
jgi:hypothetical protein